MYCKMYYGCISPKGVTFRLMKRTCFTDEIRVSEVKMEPIE
ncbi:MAG: hypothetical protein H6Q71_2866 [Firmicutes bacterium]|nr:hypothetical protein [Bacillota bacterium]